MTVEERLEALEKEVQQLKDVQAIKELKSKYFRALDTGSVSGFLNFFVCYFYDFSFYS